MARILLTPFRLIFGLVAIIAFGAGVPFLWVWVGSQLQGGTTPSLSGLGVALIGIIASYVVLTVVFAWLKERVHPTQGPVRHDWNRSLSAERLQRGQTTTAIEDIVVAATLVVGVICTIWFLFFGNPGVPVA
jgi:hypothetical protein